MSSVISTVLRNPRMLRRYRQLFLLSHMRANTSLMGHLLGASPEIEGYYEMHIGYYSWKSRWRQKLIYFGDHAAKPGGRYLFDKILHNEHEIAHQFLQEPANRVMFSLRAPGLTVPSLVNLYRRIQPDHELCDPGVAIDYYCLRLRELQRLAALCHGSYCYLDAQVLREDSERVLPRLSEWLELNQALRSEYELQKKTGESRAGDHSENLKQGKIVSAKTDYSHIEIDTDAISDAEALYRSVREEIAAGSAFALFDKADQ